MMLRNIWPAPIIATLFFISSEQENCRRTSVLNQCQFSVAKNRIHQAIRVVHLGTSQSECLIKMERFHWSTGIYCPLSWFCGIGLDLTGDYSWVTSGSVSPQVEVIVCARLWRRPFSNAHRGYGAFKHTQARNFFERAT